MGKPPATASHLIKGEHTSLKGISPATADALAQCQLDDNRIFNEARNIVIASKLMLTIATACVHAYTLRVY